MHIEPQPYKHHSFSVCCVSGKLDISLTPVLCTCKYYVIQLKFLVIYYTVSLAI